MQGEKEMQWKKDCRGESAGGEKLPVEKDFAVGERVQGERG